MKYILTLGVIILLFIGAIYLYFQGVFSPSINESNSAEITGVVTEIDRSQVPLDGPVLIKVDQLESDPLVIAAPSMGSSFCAPSVADISTLAVGDTIFARGTLDEDDRVVPCTDEGDYLEIWGVAQDAVFGYAFSYRKAPNGYVTLENTESTDPDFVNGLVLMNEKEYNLLQNSTDAREGPTSINIKTYLNPENLDAPVWAMRHPLESNYGLMLGTEKEAVIGGANAVQYTTDGLYPTDTYVVATGRHIYVLMGSYLAPEDKIRADFTKLLDSLIFTEIPTTDSVSLKIDPTVACESALAYMTFADGDGAETFVTECINGEHPEVIERYIESLDVDGATI